MWQRKYIRVVKKQEKMLSGEEEGWKTGGGRGEVEEAVALEKSRSLSVFY
jgi:hypothetical protein